MKKNNKKAFTLVELIVVITILAILATIGFVGYSSYIVSARDSSRVQALQNIRQALSIYGTKRGNELPLPEDKVEVKANGELVAYQGKLGKGIIETVGYTGEGVDPKDGSPYSYYLSANKKYFQLMAFLEDSSNLQNKASSNISFIFSKSYALDYLDRYPTVWGDKLGVLTDINNVPIEDVEAIKTAGGLDIETTTDEYRATLEDGFTLTGTGGELKLIKGTTLAGGVRNSCKVILQKSPRLKGKDGYYYINQKLPTKVYCDMTTKGGGWTRYINIKGNYSFEDAKKCWLAGRNWENASKTIECFNPNRLNFMVKELMIKEDVDGDGVKDPNSETWFKTFKDTYPSQIEKVSSGSRKCKGGKEYMTVMAGSAAYPNDELTNVSWIRLGLSFCNPEAYYREVGGRGTGNNFMNYSNNNNGGYGPLPGNRESNAKPTEIYVR